MLIWHSMSCVYCAWASCSSAHTQLIVLLKEEHQQDVSLSSFSWWVNAYLDSNTFVLGSFTTITIGSLISQFPCNCLFAHVRHCRAITLQTTAVFCCAHVYERILCVATKWSFHYNWMTTAPLRRVDSACVTFYSLHSL